MKNKKTLFFIFFLLLVTPYQVLCAEGDEPDEEEPQGLIDYILGKYNHLFEISEFVNTEPCHNLYDVFGSNIAVGIWEAKEDSTGSAKVNEDISELSGRIYIMDNYSIPSHHATKVALIIASKPTNKNDFGMAPNVILHSYDNNNSYYEMVNSNVDLTTHSYGVANSSFWGNYTGSAQNFDLAIRDHNVLSFNAAGNENNGNIYNSVIPPGTAKNAITVGATKGDIFSDVADFIVFNTTYYTY